MYLWCFFISLLPLSWSAVYAAQFEALSTSNVSFVWENISPTWNLIWHPCFDSPYECARLLVPTDYQKKIHSPPAFALALIRIPASKGRSYRGHILLNPGGPGSSGVDLILTEGKTLHKVTGDSFDLVSFDPRGSNNTTPKTVCIPNELERAVWNAQDTAPGTVVNAGVAGRVEIGRKIARAKVFGDLCQNSIGSTTLGHLGTPTTARDMLSIVEAHGETRLRYWGFSYGSILGTTFAALFPDRVERLIVDGVADAEDYYKAGWAQNLWDTDKVVEGFFTLCAENPSRCSFSKNSTTAKDIENRFDSLVNSLSERPLPVPLPGNPQLVTAWDVLFLLLQSLYTPLTDFPALSDFLSQLEEGNGTSFVAAYKPPATSPPAEQLLDATVQILCSDGSLPEDERSINKFAGHLKVLEAQSERVAGIWGDITRLHCTGWKVNANWRINGNFRANTSFPLLFITNTFDPVTPLRTAKRMASRFNGAALLEQHSYGHCSKSSASACTARHIRSYFEDGNLPAPGTLCEPDRTPFQR